VKLVTVVGARPQLVKTAAVSGAVAARAARGERPRLHEVLVHTGQHYDPRMSALFFEELGLPAPAHHLGIGSGRHGEQTGRMLEQVERVLLAEAPDAVLVYGDTNSTLAGALAAAKLGIPLAHVEAGLRSRNRAMPEEINRVVTDRLATWLFAPTPHAVANLAAEGLVAGVELAGDVTYELFRATAAAAPPPAEVLRRAGVGRDGYALVTIHRAGNTGDPARLRGILKAIAALSERLPVIWPVHPRTRAAVEGVEPVVAPRVHRVEPVGYREMVALERDARVALTDSGGVQKEVYWLGVPCVTARDETEWPETLADGRNVLAGAEPDRILAAVEAALARERVGPPAVHPVGAADAIVRRLCERAGRP
jgi:UDP-N-acetylglucosamine 2-epimerase